METKTPVQPTKADEEKKAAAIFVASVPEDDSALLSEAGKVAQERRQNRPAAGSAFKPKRTAEVPSPQPSQPTTGHVRSIPPTERRRQEEDADLSTSRAGGVTAETSTSRRRSQHWTQQRSPASSWRRTAPSERSRGSLPWTSSQPPTRPCSSEGSAGCRGHSPISLPPSWKGPSMWRGGLGRTKTGTSPTFCLPYTSPLMDSGPSAPCQGR